MNNKITLVPTSSRGEDCGGLEMAAKSWLHKTFDGKIYNKYGTEPTKRVPNQQ